jgi:hypothetical protein
MNSNSKEMKRIIDAFRKPLRLNENYNSVDFNNFPKNILKTLENEYSQYYRNKFDWNTKQDEYVKNGVFDGKAFGEWIKNNEREEFIKNIDKLITATRHDLILKIKQKNAKKVLDNFEELIIPVLGNEILTEPLSKYMEQAFLIIGSVNDDINYINKELSKEFQNAKNIIDPDGSINYNKITPSTLFNGNEISLSKFEKFAQNNPEYRGVFNDWKKLFDMQLDLSLKDLKAYRSSTPYLEIKDLYNFLINFKKKNK